MSEDPNGYSGVVAKSAMKAYFDLTLHSVTTSLEVDIDKTSGIGELWHTDPLGGGSLTSLLVYGKTLGISTPLLAIIDNTPTKDLYYVPKL